jgi:hypothetical protein
LRVPIFARSNIYWDGSAQKLTFVPADGITDNQGYQGVFFKWGSLVGISPKGDFSGDTPIYVPYNYPDDPKWKLTTCNAVETDSDIPGTSKWTAWNPISAGVSASENNIPYMDGSFPRIGETIVYESRRDIYVIDTDRNNTATYQGLRGDICQYLSTKTSVVLGDYRLPTSAEFGLNITGWNSRSDGWTKGDGSFSINNSAGKDDGTADLLSNASGANNAGTIFGSAINETMGGLSLPASGYRHFDSGALYNVGRDGMYWSGSAYLPARSYFLFLTVGGIYPESGDHRSCAFSVRCVKN